MELKDNIEFLKSLANDLHNTVEKGEEEIQKVLAEGRERMRVHEANRERLFLIQAAINNLQSLLQEDEQHQPVTEDPWA